MPWDGWGEPASVTWWPTARSGSTSWSGSSLCSSCTGKARSGWRRRRRSARSTSSGRAPSHERAARRDARARGAAVHLRRAGLLDRAGPIPGDGSARGGPVVRGARPGVRGAGLGHRPSKRCGRMAPDHSSRRGAVRRAIRALLPARPPDQGVARDPGHRGLQAAGDPAPDRGDPGGELRGRPSGPGGPGAGGRGGPGGRTGPTDGVRDDPRLPGTPGASLALRAPPARPVARQGRGGRGRGRGGRRVAPPPMPEERLQRTLARAGFGSRRSSEDLIREGRVSVNGRVAVLGDRVDPSRDVVEVDGRRASVDPGLRYLALHKPAGVTTTLRDPHAETDLGAYLPTDVRVFPVGRLDRETEGLLLLTNDGELANRLLHPRHGVEKEYLAEVEGTPTTQQIARLRRGVELDDGPARAVAARSIARSGGKGAIRVVMAEGRKREVRRMLAAVGLPVRRLIRLRVGPVGLGRLRPGERRDLTTSEVRDLYRAAGL